MSLEVEDLPPALVALHDPGLVEPLHVHVEAPPVGEGHVVAAGTLERAVVAANRDVEYRFTEPFISN